MARLFLIVPAAGIGSRMGAMRPKQYLRLNGDFLIDVTLQRLLAHPAFDTALVPLHPDDEYWSQTRSASDRRIDTCEGGAERADSVRNALSRLGEVAAAEDWVLVHDVARPCIRHDDLDHLIATLRHDAVGGLLGAPVSDTIKREDGQGHVAATVDRKGLWRAFTPQMFRFGPLQSALEKAHGEGMAITDEASAMEHQGFTPRLVAGHTDNIKVTVPADLVMAGWVLKQIAEQELLA